MKRWIASFSLVVLAALFLNFNPLNEPGTWNERTPVYEVLQYLGEAKLSHHMDTPSEDLIQKGKDIVWYGKAEGGTYVSKYYVCTNCHNMEIEDPDLTNMADPDSRLGYVKDKGLKFKQATTFYGMVNRATWYNDDYIRKYGDAVKPANKDIKNAIQLCATGCSQGRLLDDWEMDAVLAYCWSLEFKMGDLHLTTQEWEKLKMTAFDNNERGKLRDWLKTKYAQKSPATFSYPPEDKSKGYGLTGNADNGEAIYELSCMDCHKDEGVSRLVLDKSKLTLQMLKRNLTKESNFSLYEITRHGTHPHLGHKAYMPHFTLERMSHQQVEDLRAFIERGA